MSEAADLRVLIVEDNDNDALLLLRELERAGYAPQHRHVQNAEDLSEALDSQSWHIILSDYRMPRFDGLAPSSSSPGPSAKTWPSRPCGRAPTTT